MKERDSVFLKPVPRWKTLWKRSVLWMYEHDLISAKTTVRLIDVAGARLA
jgi:hypothetical protein